MGLELIPYRKFEGEEIEAIREENEELTKEQGEKLGESRRLKEIWINIQPFLTDIGCYEPKNQIQDLKLDIRESSAKEELIQSEKKLAYNKEKEREINLPYVAEKITIGYLYSLLNKEEIQKEFKNLFNLDKDNSRIEVCFASERADWILGDDGYLLIKTKNNNEEKILQAIPLQITTSTKKEIIEEKLKKIEEKRGILLIIDIKAFSKLIDQYLQYIKQKEKDEPNIKKDRQKFKDEVKAPWDLFEVYDVKEKSDILIEGRQIKTQLVNGLRFLKK